MIVLDTNVLSELMNASPDRRVSKWVDGAAPGTTYTTSITVGEISYGFSRLEDGRRKQKIAQFAGELFDRYEEFTLPFDVESAAIFGPLVADRERAGRPIGIADAQIASICLRNRAALATRNLKDFYGLDIELVDPWSSG